MLQIAPYKFVMNINFDIPPIKHCQLCRYMFYSFYRESGVLCEPN